MTPEKVTRLRKLIGPFPEKVPLHPKTIERTDCGAYLREKVEFSSEKDERIPAYVLIPKGLKTKAPAVYCHHQHANNWDLAKREVVGLSGDPNMAYAHELATRGFVTFAPDAVAFGERKLSEDGRFGNLLEFQRRILQGRTLFAKCLHDIFAGFDYLAQRPEVDARAMGFLGHSYGGRMALWSPIFEKRIRVSVSHCGCVNLRDSIEKKVGDQLIGVPVELSVPGILDVGDLEDFLPSADPCSILISATTEDRFSFGAERLFERVKPAFLSGRIELALYQGGHVFTKKMREDAYLFIDEEIRKP